MGKKFKVLVQDGEIKSPIQLGFKEANWHAAWEKCAKDDDGKMLYEAGLAIYKTLAEIRAELSRWHSKYAPGINDGELLRYFCSLPNRDRFITSRLFREPQEGKKSVFNMTTSNNIAGNELSLTEVAEGSVDGLQKAALGCVTRMSKKIPPPRGTDPLDLIEFIKGEANYSQLYGFFEGYWNALVWGDYTFSWVDKENNIAEICQEKTMSEIAFEISQIRRERLSANSHNEAMLIYRELNYKYVLLRGRGRQRKYCVENIESATDSLKFNNACFLINVSKLGDALPLSFLEKKYLDVEMTVFEILEVFRCLSLLSQALMEKFPENDAIGNATDLLAYSPKVDLNKLSKAVAMAADIPQAKVAAALDFLSYKSQDNDIWCHPILNTDGNHAALLVAALSSPNLLRVVEHWLVKLNVDLTAKGYMYEGNLIGQLNAALDTNEFAVDYDGAKTKRVNLGDGREEEIDLLMRIGSVIIVGEAKSIVSTDSPMSYYRTRQVLEKASDQVVRKTQFVKDNLIEVFRRFGITYESGREYVFVPVIINSNRMHVGFPIKGVPVCDELTLVAYFQKRNFPVLSVMEGPRPKHLAWLEVYDSSETLEINIETYLNNLPQVLGKSDHFELRNTYLPPVTETSLKLIYRRLLPADPTLSERLVEKYQFPLRTVANIQEEIAKVDIII